MTSQRRFGLAGNSAINLVAKVLASVLGLVVTPYVVARLGLRTFGFVAIITAMGEYAGLLDFGVGFTLTRAIGHADARAARDDLRRKAASGLWSSVGFLVLILLVTMIGLQLVPQPVAAGWPEGWRAAVVAVALSLGCSSVSSVYQAFPAGMGRWDLANASALARRVVYSVAVVVALHFTRTLNALALATASGAVSGVVVAYVVYRRSWPMSLRPGIAQRREVAGLWRYGLSVQTVNLVQIVNAQADKPVLLLFTSLPFVGLYELGSRIAFSLRTLALTALGPMSVEAARESARGGITALRMFYVRCYRSLMLFAVAPLVALYGASYVFVLAWLGPHYRTGGIIAVVLGVGYAVNLTTGAGTAVAMGAERPDLDRNYSCLGFVLNLVLTVMLGLLIGRWGVIAATSLGCILSSWWLLRSVDRWLGTRILSPRRLLGDRSSSMLLGYALLIGAGTAILARLLPVSTRVGGAGLCLGCLVAFGLPWSSVCARRGMLKIGVRRRLGLASGERA